MKRQSLKVLFNIIESQNRELTKQKIDIDGLKAEQERIKKLFRTHEGRITKLWNKLRSCRG